MRAGLSFIFGENRGLILSTSGGPVENKPCPACGWSNPYGAISCLRCNLQFPSVPAVPRSSKNLIATLLAAILAVSGIVLFAAMKLMSSRVIATQPYRDSLRIARESKDVQNLLGNEINADSLVFGLSLNKYGSQFVEWSTTLSGKRGSGHLYGVANEVNGIWEFSRLAMVPESGGNRVDLLPAPRPLSLPAVPEKRLYLIPVALDPSESLDWAPAFYLAKFGVKARVLPSLQADGSLINVDRQQLDSEKCVDYLQKKFAEIARDPSSILIAVTSRDIFIRSFGWPYAENFRTQGRFAVVSSARFKPYSFFAKRNPEWLASRLQKILTKNVAMLYFDLPMSSDYTSLLSGGVLSGQEVDFMSGSLIGAARRWVPFGQPGEPGITIYSIPGKPIQWKFVNSNEAFSDASGQVFNTDLALGILSVRQTDFQLEGDFPLRFVRVYRNQDERSRSFGIGASNSLDVLLIGQMGSYVDLVLEDGSRAHFQHTDSSGPNDIYRARTGDYTTAVYQDDLWTITRKDGWKLYMPYRPRALPQYVTVLTGFSDPSGHMYRMERDSFGALLSVTAPSGQWLHFEHDSQHRVQRIEASTGRVVSYEYSSSGCLSRVVDSEGNSVNYVYDDKARLLTISRAQDAPILTNTYDARDYIKTQTMADGGKFEYHYVQSNQRAPGGMEPDLVTTPNGLLTYFRYESGAYKQSLPMRPPD